MLKAAGKIITALAAVVILSGGAWGDDRAEALIKAELVKNSPWEGGDLRVEDIQVPGLDAEKYDSMSVELPRGIRNTGKVSFKVVLHSKGRERDLWGSAKLKVYKDAVVALKTIKANKLIDGGDVKLVRVDMAEAGEALVSLEEVSGMLAKRPISAGSVIKREYVKPEVIIKRGERVTLNVEGAKISIRSKGTASEDGHKGAVIAVRTASGKQITGRVAGPGEITIEF